MSKINFPKLLLAKNKRELTLLKISLKIKKYEFITIYDL